MQSRTGPLQTTRAESLRDVYRTLRASPLTTPVEIDAFYRHEMNETRGGDKTKRLRLRLNRSAADNDFFKACLMGHPGVGKSTEISRLLTEIDSRFLAIRFSAGTALDPSYFRPVDVLLVMVIELSEQINILAEANEISDIPSGELLKKIWSWFADETVIRRRETNLAASGEVGAGIEKTSLWKQLLGLFGNIKGEIRFASTRDRQITEYRLTRIKDLIPIANELIEESNSLLKASKNKEWIFVGEDFDKAAYDMTAGRTQNRISELFITYSSLFTELNTHLIFNIPISLYYSSDATRLPFPPDCSLVVPDTQVIDPYQNNDPLGCRALRAVLGSRMNIELFENDKALLNIILASGGNLRDLFSLVNYAADTALLNDKEKIGEADASEAITNLRNTYKGRLGKNGSGDREVSYDEKATRLVRIYNKDREADITDDVLYTLLNARAVQEICRTSDGERSICVHPLVVDILRQQGRLGPSRERI